LQIHSSVFDQLSITSVAAQIMKQFFVFLILTIFFLLVKCEKLPTIEILVEKKAICMKEVEALEKCLHENFETGGEIRGEISNILIEIQ
jgi:hypothetical protein